MGSVEPDVTSRRLAQILGIRPVMHDSVMLVVAARLVVVHRTMANVADGRFELWLFGDFDVLSLLLRRKDLSVDWVWRKSRMPATTVTASFSSSLFMEQRSPIYRSLAEEKYGGPRAAPIQCCPYGIGIVGNGATPQTSVAHGLGQTPGTDEGPRYPWVDAVTPGAVDRALAGKGIDGSCRRIPGTVG